MAITTSSLPDTPSAQIARRSHGVSLSGGKLPNTPSACLLSGCSADMILPELRAYYAEEAPWKSRHPEHKPADA